MNLSRRGLITGLTSLIVAPAVVKASSLMPVRCFLENPCRDIAFYYCPYVPLTVAPHDPYNAVSFVTRYGLVSRVDGLSRLHDRSVRL